MPGGEGLTYSMFLEVYLQGGIVRGILETNQDRLSNHLVVRQGDEVFSLREATVEVANRNPVKVGNDQYLIYMQEVLLIADLSVEDRAGRAGLEGLYVKKDQSKAFLSVGPYLIQGTVHLRPGSELHELIVEQSRFLPVTDATLIDRQEAGPRTLLVNRTKIGFLSTIGDGLQEF